MIRLLVFGTFAMLVRAQSNDAPVEPLPPTFHCGDRDDLPMSGKDKTCYWWNHRFNAQMLFGAAFNTALDPVLNGSTNKYWGQGVEGFSKRFGTRVAQSMAKGTGQALVGAIFREDPRFYPSRKEKFWPRVGFALTHTLIVRNDNGHQQFSAGRVAGAFSSGFSGVAWAARPDQYDERRDGPCGNVDGWCRRGEFLEGIRARHHEPGVEHLSQTA